MVPSSAQYSGIKITVTDIRKNQQYDCGNCYNSVACPLKQSVHNKTLSVTAIFVTLCNLSLEDVDITPGSWELVDSEGFTYGASAFCKNLLPLRTVNPDTWRLEPGSKVKFWLLFPVLENGVDVVALIYCRLAPTYIIVELGQISSEISEMFEAKIKCVTSEKISQDYELKAITNQINNLSAHIFSRVHNILTSKEKVSLDNTIMNEIFHIEQFLKTAKDYQRAFILPKFSEITQQYTQEQKRESDELASKKSLTKSIPELYDLTPREFEQWTATLLQQLGYTNIILTPQSGDKGIDIFAEINGQRVGVQCKKFKGVVTAPLIQSFLGALQTAEISSGIFITTGSFSSGATKIAEETAITLLDSEKIKGLIKSLPSKSPVLN